MYIAHVKVHGTAPLMQHRFPLPDLATMSKGATKRTGAKDYTDEWKEYLYVDGDEIYQPASHFEGALIKAAASFKVTGKRGMSYKDLFKSAVFVTPEFINHGVKVPKTLDTDADKKLYLDVRPVVIQKARVVRLRPTFKSGWELEFDIEVMDDQIASELVQDVLTHAGRVVGVGDYRPRFGRFSVVKFDVEES